MRTKTLDRRMVITRLGEGVDETRRLAPEAVERTTAVLRDYRSAMDSFGQEGVRAVATSALRDAENGEEFLIQAEGVIGMAPEVLSGEEEARLSYEGALSDLEKGGGERGPVLVFDIGGGSTEFVMVKGDSLVTRSIDVGCVRMSERFLSSDPPSPVALGLMESYIVGELKPVIGDLVTEPLGLAVGLAGTVTTVSGMNLGLTGYDTERIHHSRLAREQVDVIFQELAAVGVEERKTVMGLEPGRADIIVGGVSILRAIMKLAGLDEILVSEKDILDGLVIELYRKILQAG